MQREAGQLALDDALELVLLYATKRDPRFQRAARRWVGRLAVEREPSLVDLATAVAAIATAPYDVAACRVALQRVLGPQRGV